MPIIIKPMETDEEVKGKAFVHWKCWQETYSGMVDQAYLDALTLEKMEERAFLCRNDPVLVARDGDRVVGFVGYGDGGRDVPGAGEIYTLYVLPAYQGRGLGQRLLEAGLKQLASYSKICLWALRDNARAIHFYEKHGFRRDGAEKLVPRMEAAGIRMVKEN